MTHRTKTLLVALILVSTLVAVYSPALHYNFIGLDDDELVVRNQDIKVFNLDRIWHLVKRHYITLYMPLTMLSYAVDYQIWRLTPFGFRFTNLVLHFLNTFLVFYLLQLIQKNFLIALGVALIFAIHPVQIESVIWIGERKNLLSTFFFLLSVIFYWKVDSLDERKERKQLWITLGLFAMGLLSKPSVVIFVPIILMLHYFFLGTQNLRSRIWFYVIAILFCVAATATTIFGTAADVEKYTFHGGAYLTNVYIMATVFWKYWLLLALPYHQNILYSSPIYRSLLSPPVLYSVIGMVLFLITLRWIYKRNKSVAFWLGWFLVCLIPVANLIAPLPSIMNDRYLYMPIIGFFTAVFIGLEQMTKGLFFGKPGTRTNLWTFGLMGLILIPFAVLTIQRIPDWKTAETLWQSALKRAPREDSRIYYYYAINQLDLGKYERSVELFKKALALHKTTDVLLALGTACAAAEKFDEAETYLKEVIESDPKRAGAYDQLAVVYRRTKRFEEAKPLYEKAIELQPRNAVLYNNYALYFMDLNQPEQARKTWEYAVQLDPDCHFALRNLAWYHFLRKEMDPAAHYLSRYLRRNPNDKQMRDLIPLIQSEL